MQTEKVLYPEHEKMMAVKAQSLVIGDFLEWCNVQGMFLAEYRANSDEPQHVHKSFNVRLADFFNVDLKKVEAEKVAMITALRSIV